MPKTFLLVVTIVIFLALLVSCSRNSLSVYKKSKALMDTYVTITVTSDSSEHAEKAIDKAFAIIEQFGGLIDFFSEKSELTLINNNAGVRATKVSPLTLDVVARAVSVAKQSDGAFDPTVGPITRLWDFLKHTMPSTDEIRRALPLVGYDTVVVDREKSSVFLTEKGMMMDLGGIAKGYAADLAVDSLKASAITSGVVAVAGDVRCFGSKPDGTPWVVGIRNPRQTGEADEIMAKLRFTDRAVSTSGDYERFFIRDGTRYHHLLDPRTGYPARGCRSVSVVTDRGVYADAYSTAVFILGPEKGMRLVEKLGMDAVIVDDQGTIHTSPGLKGKITLEKSH